MPYKDPERQKEASRAASLRYYSRNKEACKARSAAGKFLRKKLINELKDNPCMDCERSFPAVCMHFHHRDPSTKEFEIGDKFQCAIERLMKEIEKCDLICANCHAIREWVDTHQ